MDNPDKITYFAETDFRNQKTRFGIKAKDRNRHMYIIGKTGMGKSTLEENMAIQDIQNDEGVGILDPHGSFAEKMLDYVPEHRIKDVIYFAPFDMDYPISFNVMEDVGADKRHLVVSSLISAFKKIWLDAWSARMEYILTNTLLALIEYPDSTLLGVNRMLSDKDYRKNVVDNISDPSVKAFWVNEFAKYGDKYMQEAGAAIQNKIGQFTANPLIRNIIGQPKSSFNIREIMDDKKILIINLSKGRIGEQNASLLGGMLITKIYLGAMSRADLNEYQIQALPIFYLYVDEFQSFANDSFADILAEARKYNLSLTIAHQYVEQMTDDVKAAVFGNVGTTITFRVGPLDAELLEKVFAPKFTVADIVNLGFTQIYLTLMINGAGSPPFSATTIAPFPKPDISFRDQIIENSRRNYTKHKDSIEEKIKVWHETSFDKKKENKINEFKDNGREGRGEYPRQENQRNFNNVNQKPAQHREFNLPSRAHQQLAFTKSYSEVKPAFSAQSKAIPVSHHKIEPKPVFTRNRIEIPNVLVKTSAQTNLANKKLSPQLKDILSKLEKDTPKEQIVNPTQNKPTPVSLSSLNSAKPQTFSTKSKEATSANMDMLRKTLKKAMNTPEATKPTSTQGLGIIKEEVKKYSIANSSTMMSNNQNPSIKEVPEDVLQKILE